VVDEHASMGEGLWTLDKGFLLHSASAFSHFINLKI
jgi:hypothetical protein